MVAVSLKNGASISDLLRDTRGGDDEAWRAASAAIRRRILDAEIPAGLAGEIRDRIAPGIEIAYGLTETAPLLTISRPDANAGPGHRRLGQTKAERLKEAAATSIAVAELDAEVAFEVGLLLDQYDLLGAQIERAEDHLASLLDSELADGEYLSAEGLDFPYYMFVGKGIMTDKYLPDDSDQGLLLLPDRDC